MEVIRVEDVSKVYPRRNSGTLRSWLSLNSRRRPPVGEHAVLKSVSLSVHSGDSVALVGPNGSGKSTLLRIIAGITPPSGGSVVVRGRVVPILELGSGFSMDLTGRQNAYLNASALGIPAHKLRERFDQVVEFSGLGGHMDKQVRYYSSGMISRLAFSVALNVEPDILLLDEVLAVGDSDFRLRSQQALEAIRERGTTIVLVTHNKSVASGFCQRIVELRDGQTDLTSAG